MGVYIKGMEMPKDEAVALYIYPDGRAKLWRPQAAVSHEFEAIPVPPHGALMDEAELWVEINKICDRRDAGIISDLTCIHQLLSAVRHAPTVISAEEG